MDQYKCRICFVEKFRFKIRRKDNPKRYTYYIDENAKRWNKTVCPPCAILLHSRRLGRKPRSEVMEHKNRLGYISELTVKEALERLGFIVEQARTYGPDLTIDVNGIKVTCEVKTACKTPKGNSYFTTAVYPLRQNDNLVAIVLPNKRIVMCTMKSHLEMCTNSGKRTVTSLVNKIGINSCDFEEPK